MIFTEKYMNHRSKEAETMNKKKKLDQNTIQTAKRLLKYMTGTHKIQFIIVFICIFISSAASIAVSLSLKFLLDDFIIPLIGQTDPNFAELYKALAVLGCIFALGVIATFIYTRMMVYIGQGVLKSVRDDMFEHMQTLPIRYFDQNTNGSVMSLYTNDTDTLRQMISQAIPQALMALFTIVVTFISMLLLSPLLTILAVVIIFIMLKVTSKIGSNSGKYFIRQQVSLADVTGFVEERMNGIRHLASDAEHRRKQIGSRTKIRLLAQIFHRMTLLLKRIIGCGRAFDGNFIRLDFKRLLVFRRENHCSGHNQRRADILFGDFVVIGDLFTFKHDLHALEAAAVVQIDKAERLAVADASCPTAECDGFAVKRHGIFKNILDDFAFHGI